MGTGGALGGSGITTMADQMTKTLAEMGHQPVRLVSGDRRRERPNRLNLENVLAVLSEAASVGRAARSQRVGLVWLHTFGVPTLPAIRTLVQVLAVRGVGRPIIVQLHAYALAGQLASGSRLLRTVIWLLGRLSRSVVVLQEADAEELRRRVDPDKVAILANWVDVPDEPTPLPPVPPVVAVFVGGLVERKGVPQLLDAMRLLEDVPMVLHLVGSAGEDGDAAAAALRASVADLEADGRVVFMGQLERPAVRAELAAAHLLVLPSRAEGMPMAVLEALAEGRPVLVSNVGEMAALVREHRCGVVIASQDARAIAESLSAAVSDLPRLAEQGRRGHQTCVNHFSPAAAAHQLGHLLTS